MPTVFHLNENTRMHLLHARKAEQKMQEAMAQGCPFAAGIAFMVATVAREAALHASQAAEATAAPARRQNAAERFRAHRITPGIQNTLNDLGWHGGAA
ncbi:MAG TPA: hypothetical protein VHB73_01150 [Alphaproteobacteria bacterium]|nr:hypothetical protein [Alphaproteobacteria bacterium]